jgi:hypothetical protein
MEKLPRKVELLGKAFRGGLYPEGLGGIVPTQEKVHTHFHGLMVGMV